MHRKAAMSQGRRRFDPTDEQRGNVEAMVGYGIPEAEICKLITNPESGKPIDEKTLRKYFATEIATGATKATAKMAAFLFTAVIGSARTQPFKDERARMSGAQFWLRTRAGWSETSIHKHTGVKGGDPIELKYAEADLDRKIMRALARSRQAETPPQPE